MDAALERRLARIVERLRTSPPTSESDRERERRLGRERVLAELPRLAARIRATVDEINDSLAEAGAALRLAAPDHTPASEALFKLTLSGASEFDPTLELFVDGEGRARGLLERDNRRSLLLATTVFELGKGALADLMLTLLEAHSHRP
jgi:hypothetical protein